MKLLAKAAVAIVVIVAVANPAIGHTMLDKAHEAFTSISGQVQTHLSAPPQVTPAPAQAAEGPNYRYTAVNKDHSPVRWDPCTTHDIIVNLNGASEGAMADLKKAVAELDAATGVKFRITGTTNTSPTENWGLHKVNGQWPPILVAWQHAGDGLVDQRELGVTYPAWVPNNAGEQVLVSAAVIFASTRTDVVPGFKPGTLSRGAIMLHELGHMAGLDHVDDPAQLMYPQVGLTAGYAAGDRVGLKNLGAGGCLAVP